MNVADGEPPADEVEIAAICMADVDGGHAVNLYIPGAAMEVQADSVHIEFSANVLLSPARARVPRQLCAPE